jgi:Flp pilus assembly protein TadD
MDNASAGSDHSPQWIDVPEEGTLESFSVPMLLARAWRDRRSSCLQISQGKNERRIQIRDGAPVAIDIDPTEDTLAQTLVDSRLIASSDRITVERMATERRCPQASAVLALKLLDANSLYQALRTAARTHIAETFNWASGHYRWMPASADEHASAKPHDILSIFQEQLPRQWGTERLFQSLMEVQEVHGDISPRFRKVALKLASAGEHAESTIQRLDGTIPLGRVLGECAGDSLAAATLWTVFHTGILRRQNSATQIGIPTELEFDVKVEVAGGTVQASTESAATDSESNAAVVNARDQALQDEIESRLEQLGCLDHYSALDIAEDAGPAQIKKAYFNAAKKYHPDAMARPGLDELKESAARVFARIAEAFETLSDPAKKAAYDAGGSMEPEIDTDRLAQAETSFRKGEVLQKMGNFDGAIEYLQPAVDLWPEEPAYQAGLGWALYKQPRSNPVLAAHHLETALSQDPSDAVIRFRLGMVLRATGDDARAKELIEKARSI